MFTPHLSAPVKPAMRVDVFSHHVTFSGYGDDVKHALLQYCRGLGHYGLKMVAPRQFVRAVMAVYAARTADSSEVRFHINHLQDVLRHLANYGYGADRLQVVEHPLYEPLSVVFDKVTDQAAREYQIPLIEYLIATGKTKVLTLQTGKGKLQPLDAKIRIPGGWTTMGEVYLGQLVSTPDGGVAPIVGIYPHGKKAIYKVTFADGRSTECGAEHLWKVYYINTVKHRRWRVVDTMEMMRLISMPNPRVYVPLPEPEDCIPASLPLDPYLLGALLGNGGMSQGTIGFTSADEFTIGEVDRLLKAYNHRLVHRNRYNYDVVINDRSTRAETLRSRLAGLGLYGCLSYDKFIPEAYLEGSLEQRWALLQGLMDTDGAVNSRDTGGATSYGTSSERLAKDVQYLVRSLGGIASISSRIPTYTHKGEKKEGALAYDVNIRVKTPSKLFRLTRKLERTNDNNQYAADLKLRVMSIEPIGEKEAQCIAVDHPEHLYITDDFIVTHNTFTSLKAIAELGIRTALVIKGMYVEKWVRDVYETLGLGVNEVMVVRGSKDLKILIELAQAGQLEEIKFFIITNKTLANFYKAYERASIEPYEYSCTPEEFYPLLRIGVRLIDEVHQEFHSNFRQDLYTHVPKTISLSATLDSDDQFINRMYGVMFPPDCRPHTIDYDKYIDVMALEYQLTDFRRVKFMGVNKMYSHIKFEQSILRYKDLTAKYLKMISDIALDQFIDVFEAGQRMLIFCSTIEMCTALQKHMRERFSDVMIGRYVGEDDYSVLETNDIIVTTLKSAGTAVDISGLRVCLMTDSISSKQANIQALGRLRPLKRWPDLSPLFIYLYAGNVDKHRQYAQEKQQKFSGKVRSHRTLITQYHI